MSDAAAAPAPTLRLWLILAALALALLAAAQFGYHWLQAQGSSPFTVSADCDLARGCSAVDGERQLSLRLDGLAGSHQPLTASVQLDQLVADTLILDLQGVDMFMGVNQYPLTRTTEGRFQTQLQLPVCTTGRMQWRARLLLQRGGQQEFVDFTFWAQ